jgi:hypothetical protein
MKFINISKNKIDNNLLTIILKHKTLEEIIMWSLSQTPPILINNIIHQNEYTLDVMVPYKNFYIVYDTT